MRDMMNAAFVIEPGRLEVVNVAAPTITNDYDALCDVLYGSTCVGTDLHIIDGVFPWLPSPRPTLLGHESVGRVRAVGSKVRHLRIGDRVTRVWAPERRGQFTIAWGGFAEQAIARDWKAMRDDGIPQSEWNAHRVQQAIPDDIASRDATLLITLRETHDYLRRIGIGRSILVIGSGANALAFVAHAKNGGSTTIVAVGSAGRRDVFRAAGATTYFDYKSTSLVDDVSAIQPDGFDVVIDAKGIKTSADLAIRSVAAGGCFGLYGIDDLGEYRIDPIAPRGPIRIHPNQYDEADAHQAVVADVVAGRLEPALWLGDADSRPLAEVPEAYEELRKRDGPMKSVIRLLD